MSSKSAEILVKRKTCIWPGSVLSSVGARSLCTHWKSCVVTEWTVMRWRRFTRRWCSPSSSPAWWGFATSSDKGWIEGCTRTTRGSAQSVSWPDPTASQLAEDAENILADPQHALFFTTFCQAELTTRINCDLAVMTVLCLWLLSLTPETSDSCSKTCISVHELKNNLFYPHIVHCCVLSTFH